LLEESARDAEKFRKLSDNTSIVIEPAEDSKAEMLLDDPTDYKLLFREAYRLVGSTGAALEERVNQVYEHELLMLSLERMNQPCSFVTE
jgi:hypothetical protein